MIPAKFNYTVKNRFALISFQLILNNNSGVSTNHRIIQFFPLKLFYPRINPLRDTPNNEKALLLVFN